MDQKDASLTPTSDQVGTMLGTSLLLQISFLQKLTNPACLVTTTSVCVPTYMFGVVTNAVSVQFSLSKWLVALSSLDPGG